jgi:3',5'-cyclic AMP phosphodiesterase CpdA
MLSCHLQTRREEKWRAGVLNLLFDVLSASTVDFQQQSETGDIFQRTESQPVHVQPAQWAALFLHPSDRGIVLTLLQISDLHFGPPYLPHVGEALLQIAPTLAADAIVVSGDLTQRAKREQFAEAKAFLDRLPAVPIVVVPGNHDVPLFRVVERWRDPYGLYREFINSELDHVVQLENATIVALNSTSPRSAITNGRVHREQLDFCSEAFGNAPAEAARIVVAHHHFAPAPDYERDQTMSKAKRAMNRFVELGVDLILGGHLHRAYIGNSLDFYPGNHRDRGIVIVQCGTTTSHRGRGREREKNSFNLVAISNNMLKVTHYMYFHEDDGFQPVSCHAFPRAGKPFVESP